MGPTGFGGLSTSRPTPPPATWLQTLVGDAFDFWILLVFCIFLMKGQHNQTMLGGNVGTDMEALICYDCVLLPGRLCESLSFNQPLLGIPENTASLFQVLYLEPRAGSQEMLCDARVDMQGHHKKRAQPCPLHEPRVHALPNNHS